MNSYDTYKYHKGEDHYSYGRYPYESSSSQVRSYNNPHDHIRVPVHSPKRRYEATHDPQVIPRDVKSEDKQNSMNQIKGRFTATSPTMLTAPHHLPSEKISSKANPLILPIQNEEETSQKNNSSRYFPSPEFIPLIEEEDHEGYEDQYSLHEGEQQRQHNQHAYSYMGPLQKEDSPSNYKPFGTHFGPRILNRYGGHADFLTPQAKHMVPHQYGNPGDSSTKSNPFNKNGHPGAKTKPATSQGFSSLAEHVVKSKVPAPDAADS